MGWKEKWDEAAKKGETVLFLGSQRVDDTAATAIAERLVTDTRLTGLYLFDNQIGDVGASIIAESLAINSTLNTLNLYSNQIGDVGASKIAESLAINSTLTRLDLGGNQLGEVGANKIGETLSTNTALTVLVLSRNQIGEVGASRIGESLAVNAALATLNLNSNLIGDDGGQRIGEALAVNTALTELSLQNNQIGDIGASEIGESLVTNTTLTEITLDDNQIGDTGASKIGESLATNATLISLRLQNNQIGDVGAITIAESLSTNAALTTLKLSSNRIGDVGARTIGKSLVNNTTLKTLDLDNNGITEQSVQALARVNLNRIQPIGFGWSIDSAIEPVLNQLKRDQELWKRLKDDVVPATTCKVIMCGRWGAGKTTLADSLRARSLNKPAALISSDNRVRMEDRTIGMRLVDIKCDDGTANRLMIHDMGGQDEFHVQHDRVMSDPNAIFVLLCNLAKETLIDTLNGQITEEFNAQQELSHLKYWLSYIYTHNKVVSKPRVLIVGTRGVGRSAQGNRLMQSCLELFNELLDLHPSMYLLDGSLAHSQELIRFWKDLQQEARKKLHGSTIPKVCSQIIQHQAKLCQDLGVIARWSEFSSVLTDLIGPVFTDEQLQDVCEYLHSHGHVLYFRQDLSLCKFIVLGPSLFSELIGQLLAHTFVARESFPNFIMGSCLLAEVHCHFANLEEKEVVSLLDRFELAYQLPDGKLLFPVHLPAHAGIPLIAVPPRLHLNEAPILLCRRFASRSDADRLTHGAFPRFQVRLHRVFQHQLELMENFAHVSIAEKEVYATLIYHKLEGFIDLAVWGQPREVLQLVVQLRCILFEDHMLLLRMHEQVISAQMTIEGVPWPLPVAIPLTKLEALEPTALVDLYALTPSHLKVRFGAANRNERVASLLHGYPAWGTGNQCITLDEFYTKFIEFCRIFRESSN